MRILTRQMKAIIRILANEFKIISSFSWFDKIALCIWGIILVWLVVISTS